MTTILSLLLTLEYQIRSRCRSSRMGLVAVTVLLMVAVLPALALAADPTEIGVNMSEWLIRNISGLFTVALIVGAIVFLIRREVMGFLGFMALAAVVAFVVFAPSSFKCVAINLGNKILGTTASCS